MAKSLLLCSDSGVFKACPPAMPSPSPEAKELPDIWDKGQFVELLNKAACTMLGAHSCRVS